MNHAGRGQGMVKADCLSRLSPGQDFTLQPRAADVEEQGRKPQIMRPRIGMIFDWQIHSWQPAMVSRSATGNKVALLRLFRCQEPLL